MAFRETGQKIKNFQKFLFWNKISQIRTSPIERELLDLDYGKLALIYDGTYAYFQKRSYNEFQRASYSVQKGQNLAKPFIGCTTTKRIIGVYGPYTANASDGDILPQLLKDDYSLKNLLQKEDTFILDHGFRISVAYLERKGFNVEIPTCGDN